MGVTNLLVAVSAGMLIAASAAHGFPISGKPIRLIVPFPAGGEIIDASSRYLGQQLGEALGVAVIVENRPGAGTVIGNQVVASSPPDGHTLLYGASTAFTMLPHQLSNRPYDEFRDFTPITNVLDTALFLAAHSSVPAKDLKELVAYAKANPGKLSYAAWQLGGLNHVCFEMLKRDAGIDILYVPYKSFLDAQRDVYDGRVQLIFSATQTHVGMIRSGKLQGLAVIGNARMYGLEDVATFAEQGYKGYETIGGLAILGPARLPPDVIKRLNQELTRILRLPETIAFVRKINPSAVVRPSSPEELSAQLRAQHDYWSPILRRLGIRLD